MKTIVRSLKAVMFMLAVMFSFYACSPTGSEEEIMEELPQTVYTDEEGLIKDKPEP